MKNQKSLLESLSRQLGPKMKIRRYNLPDMISESYKALYQCEKGTNLQRLAEAHLEDVRRNPKDIERLSRQLSIVKEVIRMNESGDISDKDLATATASKIEGDVEEEVAKDREERTAPTEEIKESKDEELDESDLTDEELEELAKHLTEIRKSKEVKEGCSSKKMKESKGRKLKKRVNEEETPEKDIEEAAFDGLYHLTKDEISRIVRYILKKYGSEISEYDYIDLVTLVVGHDEVSFDELDSELEKAHIHVRTYESKAYESLDLSEFCKKSNNKAFVKTFKKLDKQLHEGTALTRQESISLYKAANSAMTHLSVELEHNPEFLSTFKESVSLLSKDVSSLLGSLKEGKAPSKATMKSLAKFSESLLKEEKVYYPNGEECRDDSVDMDKALDFMYGTSRDKDKSKYSTAEKQKAVTYWIEKSEKMQEAESDEELPPIEDEEEVIVSAEEVSEEEEQFDQEYADARVELHKELAEEHADSEDPTVKEKLDIDADEIASLPGVTEKQLADIGKEVPPTEDDVIVPDVEEDEMPEEVEEKKIEIELDDEVTDDELSELKKHLKEMRELKKLKESKGRKLRKPE